MAAPGRMSWRGMEDWNSSAMCWIAEGGLQEPAAAAAPPLLGWPQVWAWLVEPCRLLAARHIYFNCQRLYAMFLYSGVQTLLTDLVQLVAAVVPYGRVPLTRAWSTKYALAWILLCALAAPFGAGLLEAQVPLVVVEIALFCTRAYCCAAEFVFGRFCGITLPSAHLKAFSKRMSKSEAEGLQKLVWSEWAMVLRRNLLCLALFAADAAGRGAAFRRANLGSLLLGAACWAWKAGQDLRYLFMCLQLVRIRPWTLEYRPMHEEAPCGCGECSICLGDLCASHPAAARERALALVRARGLAALRGARGRLMAGGVSAARVGGDAAAPMLTRLSCGHAFHQACAAQWVRERESCPTCRSFWGKAEAEEALAELITDAVFNDSIVQVMIIGYVVGTLYAMWLPSTFLDSGLLAICLSVSTLVILRWLPAEP